jgi:hypothetical protein
MNYVRNYLEIFIRNAIEQAIVATVLTILGSLAVSELSDTVASAVSALAQSGWHQLFSPSPPTPAGDITARVIKIWISHVAEVELPKLRLGRGRGDPCTQGFRPAPLSPEPALFGRQ